MSTSLLAPMDPYGYEGGLSPEGLMIYIADRLEGLDEQVNVIFAKQEAIDGARSALAEIAGKLGELEDQTDDPEKTKPMPGIDGKPQKIDGGAAQIERDIFTALAKLEEIDPKLGSEVRQQLEQPEHILNCTDGYYFPAEVRTSTAYIENKIEEIEAGAQLGMVRLQSLMSSRQTAIQLSTNLISSLGESQKAIASNVGR